jgi:hypothetical protein
MLKETKAKDTPWNYGQRVKNFGDTSCRSICLPPLWMDSLCPSIKMLAGKIGFAKRKFQRYWKQPIYSLIIAWNRTRLSYCALTSDFGLKGYLAGRDPDEYVLAPKKTIKGNSKYRYDNNKRVRSHFKRVGVKSTYHDMRQSFASNLASAGVPIYKIAEWLGDGVEVTVRSYGHLAPKDPQINRGGTVKSCPLPECG